MRRIFKMLTFAFLPFLLATGCDTKKPASSTLPMTIAYDARNKKEASAAFAPHVVFGAKTDAIQGMYIQSKEDVDTLLTKETAAALVAVTPENAQWLIEAKKAQPELRGLVDFSATARPMTRDELAEVVSKTNGSGAKIALLSCESANRESVRYLQSRLITVWVRTADDLKNTLTQLTNGANGIMTDNPAVMAEALSLLAADVPTLLRPPMIIAHRGMPSGFIENTLRSELAGAAAGAELLEYDIRLSADDEIFVLHDKSMERLFNRPDIEDVEKLTLKELQAIPFDRDSANGVQSRNHTRAKDAPSGSISIADEDRIPSLRELFELFKDSDVGHLIEIKTANPAIVPKFKALAEEYGMDKKMAVITFNVPILTAMAEFWPEMSLGCLGYDNAVQKRQKEGKTLDPTVELPYANHAQGTPREAALALNRIISPYNGTYNPSHAELTRTMVEESRHYGITAWPWTYNTPETFAKDYLFDMNGLTTNFAFWASDLPTFLTASDGEMAVGGTLPVYGLFAPVLLTRTGEKSLTDGAEIVLVSGGDLLKIEGDKLIAKARGTAVFMLRTRIPLTFDGKNYGAYYLYSNPVSLGISD